MTTTMTPTEIDTQLADLYAQEATAAAQGASAIEHMHHDLGHRRQYQGRRSYWAMNSVDTIAAARAVLADESTPVYQRRDLTRTVERHDNAVAQVKAIREAAAPLEAEYASRRWSRFFTVDQSNGHIHSSMHCSTCNRGGSRTSFGWNPELSGKTEAEAVDELGPRLCTVCFASAPVEYTQGVVDDSACPGSGQAPVDGSIRRNWSSAWGQCTACPTRQMVTSRGVVRKHKKAKA